MVGKFEMTSYLRTNAFAATILFAVVALSPLPLGSTAPLFIAAECGMLGLAAITLTLRTAQNVHIALLLCLALVPVAYLVVIHEQISEHPWLSYAFPSPWWGRASAALAEPLRGTRSVIRDQSWYSLGAPLLASLALLNSLIICTDRIWARRLIDWVLWVGTAYAVFGIASFVSDPTHILAFEKYAYRDVLTSTFINRNTAAVYFGTCLILAAVKVAVALRERKSSGVSFRSRWRVLPDIPRAALLPAAFCLINLVAVLMTASRAGAVLSVFASAVSVGLVFRSRLTNMRAALVALAGTGAAIGILLVLIGGAVTSRFASQGLGDGGRFEIYVATLPLVEDNWLFGTGLGTFRWGFSPYRPDNVPIWGIWDREHNTLLEIAAEGGLPLAGVVLAAALAIAILLFRGAIIRRMDRDIPIVGFGVALLGFTHAMIDFSLQIPGYAITAFAIMGAGLAQSFSTAKSPLFGPRQ
jgi:hypothetical protein